MACEFSRRGGVVTLQEKTVTASASGAVSVSPDSGYNGLSKVTVNQVLLQDRTITPATLPYTVSPTGSYVGLRRATINKDSNLVAGNIKKGVSIFGVTGTLEQAESKIAATVKPTTVNGKVCLELVGIPSTATIILGFSILPVSGTSVGGTYIQSVQGYSNNGFSIQNDSSSLTSYFSPASVNGGVTSANHSEIRSGGKIYLYVTGQAQNGAYSLRFDANSEYYVYAMYG